MSLILLRFISMTLYVRAGWTNIFLEKLSLRKKCIRKKNKNKKYFIIRKTSVSGKYVSSNRFRKKERIANSEKKYRAILWLAKGLKPPSLPVKNCARCSNGAQAQINSVPRDPQHYGQNKALSEAIYNTQFGWGLNKCAPRGIRNYSPN